MDVILKVLKGARVGTKIALKRDKFLIGRSQKCQLRVGSTSVSRRHCQFMRKDNKVFLQDLGSRNGTLLNGNKITNEVELSSGDEIDVGSLSFLLTISPGIANVKKPEVKTVADAVDRASANTDSYFQDDDISNWLLDSGPATQNATETQSIRMDETNAVHARRAEQDTVESEANPAAVLAETDEVPEADLDDSKAAESEGKNTKQPGKLPPVPARQVTKDSREAAIEALRSWNRRR